MCASIHTSRARPAESAPRRPSAAGAAMVAPITHGRRPCRSELATAAAAIRTAATANCLRRSLGCGWSIGPARVLAPQRWRRSARSGTRTKGASAQPGSAPPRPQAAPISSICRCIATSVSESRDAQGTNGIHLAGVEYVVQRAHRAPRGACGDHGNREMAGMGELRARAVARRIAVDRRLYRQRGGYRQRGLPRPCTRPRLAFRVSLEESSASG